MNRFIVGFVILVCLSANAHAQGQTSQPESIPAAVDKIFSKWDKAESPGCALAVIRDGQIVYKRGYGMADLDHDVPITPSTVFHVASVSKHFTTAAIILLAQQGKLSFDDEVRKYVPELPDFGTSITIRHLIHHTSGLRDQWSLLGLAGWRYSLDLITDEDVLEMVSRQKDLNFRPGEKYIYSNTGYTLLAVIVRRVSGQSFREFTNAQIFQPLGMKSTHFRDDHAEIVKQQAYGYVPTKSGTFRLSITNFDTVGATSLLTTVEDLALWDRNFYDKRVGGSALIEQFQQRGKLNNGEQLDYAFGLVVGKYRGLPIVEHAGGDAGYRAHFIRFPEQRFSAACLCNISEAAPYALVRKVADIYLEKDMKEALPSLASSELVRLSEEQLRNKVGLYWHRDSDQFQKILMKDGKLYVIPPGDEEGIELKPLSESRFRLGELPVEVRFEAPTPGKRLRLATVGLLLGGKPEFFEPVDEVKPTRPELEQYVGTYASDEIESIYRIVLEGDKLVLKRLRAKPAILEPTVRDVFDTSLGTLRFTRDAKNQVTGIVLNSDRIRNFRFARQTR